MFKISNLYISLFIHFTIDPILIPFIKEHARRHGEKCLNSEEFYDIMSYTQETPDISHYSDIEQGLYNILTHTKKSNTEKNATVVALINSQENLQKAVKNTDQSFGLK